MLERLIQREPQNAQHRNKLQFVKSQMGGVDTIPAKPKSVGRSRSAPPMPSLEIEEPAPSFETSTTTPSFDLDLDASPSRSSSILDRALRRQPRRRRAAAAAVAPRARRSRWRPPISSGERGRRSRLHHRAPHRSGGVREVRPRGEGGRASARRPRARAEEPHRARAAVPDPARRGRHRCRRAPPRTQYIDVLMEHGDDDAIASSSNEFLSRGHALDAASRPRADRRPRRSRPSSTSRRAASAASPKSRRARERARRRASSDLDDVRRSRRLGVPRIDERLDEPAVAELRRSRSLPKSRRPERSSSPTSRRSRDLELDERRAELADSRRAGSSASSARATRLRSAEPVAEEIGEIDFYIEQELFDEAREQASRRLPHALPGRRRRSNVAPRRRIDAAAAAGRAAATAAVADVAGDALARRDRERAALRDPRRRRRFRALRRLRRRRPPRRAAAAAAAPRRRRRRTSSPTKTTSSISPRSSSRS